MGMQLSQKHRDLLYILQQSDVPYVELCFTKGKEKSLDFFCPKPEVLPPKAWATVQKLMLDVMSPHIPADIPFCRGSITMKLEPEPVLQLYLEELGGFRSIERNIYLEV